MAGGSLLLLLDDISILMDDVSVMTKIAAKKTAGLVGDDLALNAEQVTGVKPNRELPVIWAVAKGSSVNKLILVVKKFWRALKTTTLSVSPDKPKIGVSRYACKPWIGVWH